MTTTRFPNGVTNVSEGSIFAELGQLAPPLYHTYMEDFDYYVQSQWDETIVGGATIANQNLDGGVLYLNLPALADEAETVVKAQTFYLASLWSPGVTKKTWFETSVIAQTPLDGEMYVGLATNARAQGLYFAKPSGSAQFEFWVNNGTVNIYVTPIPEAVLTNTSWLRLGFVVEPGGEISLFVNGQPVGMANGATNMSTQTPIGAYAAARQSANPNAMLVDYIFACKER